MKILIAATHFSVSSGRYIYRAMTRLGHDVRSIGPGMGAMIWGVEIEKKYEWIPDFAPDETGLNAAFADWKPDLVITADSAYSIAGKLPCPHVLWGQDNHVRDYQIGVTWDAMFLAHSWANRMDEPNAHWLPPCYDPVVCTDLGLAREFDVCMIGYPYEDRVKIMGALKEAGLKTFTSIGAIWDQYNNIYNHAKIALVKSIAGDVTNRFLENRAQNCCILADKPKDADKMGFVAGVDYWTFEGVEGAVREAKMLLDTGLYKTVAAAGKEAGASHSWDTRCLQLLDVMGLS